MTSTSEKKSTLVLLGAGIQENSWTPVIHALHRTAYPGVATDDAANTALAQLVYQARFWKMVEQSEVQRFGAIRDETRTASQAWTTAYSHVCSAICEDLADAETRGDIQLRPNFERVWNAFIAGPGEHCFLTTNWDRAIATEVAGRWGDTNEDTVQHIHGDRRDPGSLLLPTEVAQEPYKTPDRCSAIGRRRSGIMKAMERATRLVIYGLGLSPLDIELANVVTIGIDKGNVEEVVVINPDHAVVAARLRILLRDRKPRIVERDPRGV